MNMFCERSAEVDIMCENLLKDGERLNASVMLVDYEQRDERIDKWTEG